MPRDDERELFRCADILRLMPGGAKELSYSSWSGTFTHVSGADLEVALSCSRFETPGGHASRIAARSSGSADAIRARLISLAEAGLLVPLGALMRRQQAREKSARRIGCIAIPTCGRPEQLARALRSYGANARDFGHDVAFVVADGSSDAEQIAANRRATFEVSRDSGALATYAGSGEVAELISELCADGEIPESMIRFGLAGFGKPGQNYGANRNVILLHTAGSSVLSVDDDTVCCPGIAPGVSSRLRLRAESEPPAAWSFPDTGAALSFQSATNLDVLSEHSRLLGRSVFDVVVNQYPDLSQLSSVLDDARFRLWQGICDGRARVMATVNGLAGDSGMGDTRDAVRLNGDQETRRRWAAKSVYLAALGSRDVVRQSLTPVISGATQLMTTCIGLDNTTLLPPFFSVYRNEDGVFGAVLQQCCPHGFVGSLPFTLQHLPGGVRSNPPEQAVRPIRFSELLCAYIASWSGAPNAVSPAMRFRLLGQYLVELGSLPEPEFLELANAPLLKRHVAGIATCEALLAKYNPAVDDPWRLDLQTIIRGHERSLQNRHAPLPVEVLQDYAGKTLRGATGGLVKRYGQLLCWWPAIVEKASHVVDHARR